MTACFFYKDGKLYIRAVENFTIMSYNNPMNFKYEIIRTDRKTVGITVKNGAVTVRAPGRVSKKELDRIVEKHRGWIEKKLSESSEDPISRLTEDDTAFLRKISKSVLSKKVEYFSSLTGLSPERIRISSARKRFGSCSSKGTVSFSLYLMLYPESAVDLVVVHELCHLKYMDHSKDFYRLLEKYVPDHKVKKELLRSENIAAIEEIKDRYVDFFKEK